MTNLYRPFVKDFSTIASPLNDIFKKEVDFKWEKEQQDAFDNLKYKLTHALILALPNFEKSFEI